MLRDTLLALMLFLPGCATTAQPVGALEPRPLLDVPRRDRVLGLDLGPVPDAFHVAAWQSESEDYERPDGTRGTTEVTVDRGFDVVEFRRSLQNGFDNALRGFAQVQIGARPDGDTLQVAEATLALEDRPGRHRHRHLLLRYRARLTDAGGRDLGHSFGELRGGEAVVAREPDSEDDVVRVDYGPAVRELIEQMIAQIARDMLVQPAS
jgi:hypothetical protein